MPVYMYVGCWRIPIFPCVGFVPMRRDHAAYKIPWPHHDEASVGCMEYRASVKQQLLRGTSLCMMRWYMGIPCPMDVCWSAVGMWSEVDQYLDCQCVRPVLALTCCVAVQWLSQDRIDEACQALLVCTDADCVNRVAWWLGWQSCCTPLIPVSSNPMLTV